MSTAAVISVDKYPNCYLLKYHYIAVTECL